MTQDFAQHFIHLCGVRLAAETFTELALNHAERRLDVRAAVIPVHEPVLIHLVVKKRVFAFGG